MQKARAIKAIADVNSRHQPRKVNDAEALVIATEWKGAQRGPRGGRKEKMTTPIVFDGRNLLDPETMGRLGFHYYSIGRASVKPQ